MTLVVVADSAAEEQEIREEILGKAERLQRFGLHLEDLPRPAPQGAVSDSAVAEGAAADAAAANDADGAEACHSASAPDDSAAAVPAALLAVDDDCEVMALEAEAEFYIVVRALVSEAERICGDEACAETEAEAILERLLDVPEAADLQQADPACDEDLAVLTPATHPLLCARLRRFLADLAIDAELEAEESSMTCPPCRS
eukprot:TRINITY_DN48445_c0_g1_i1.p2 TRINITY_DN48445_c0_g1~~TRINITY_DN48445_c0_g1_i1.p2  ORF type:complete len:201 (+),score=74.37 TRINITY_DN48445_c0_g1_i1:63-665(+)